MLYQPHLASPTEPVVYQGSRLRQLVQPFSQQTSQALHPASGSLCAHGSAGQAKRLSTVAAPAMATGLPPPYLVTGRSSSCLARLSRARRSRCRSPGKAGAEPSSGTTGDGRKPPCILGWNLSGVLAPKGLLIIFPRD